MIKTPKLEDAHAMSILHKSSFEQPSKAQFERLQVGDFAQVNCNGERFWCRILFNHNGNNVGKIDNELDKTEEHDLQSGDLIAFENINIYKIMPDEKREKMPKYLAMPHEETNSLYILHAHKPKFIGKIISEQPVKMKDVLIIDEPVDYAKEMPILLKDMADWLFYKFVKE